MSEYDYQVGTILNPKAPADSFEAKQPYIDNGTAVADKRRYFSPEFMGLEWDRLWTRTWLIAAVSSDLPEVGCYSVFDIGRESIIVTRTPDGVRAFYNACSHRGTRLVNDQMGKTLRFVCPFHSWRFSSQTGELLAITDEETFRAEVICERPGLTPVACEEHAGIIFINMREDPPPLLESIGLPEGYLEAYNIDQMKVIRHISTEWEANWKIGIEAFYETYHLHAVHPETRWVMGDLNVQYDLYPNGSSRMIVPLAQMSPRIKDQTAMNEGLEGMLLEAGIDPAGYEGDASGVRVAIQKAKRQRAARLGLDYSKLVDGQLTDSWATGLFPNVQIGCHPEGVFLMRFLPHPKDPERFFYDTMTLFLPADDPNYTAPAWMGVPEGMDTSGSVRPDLERFGVGEDGNLGLVLSQDSSLLPIVQAGIHSRGFKGQLWGEQEQRLRHFDAELERYITGEK
jgi:phenylpropionate dioxygenase-like ring-hydroxylating dioxygenase large terminal subunit